MLYATRIAELFRRRPFARILGVEKELGSVEEGKRANLVERWRLLSENADLRRRLGENLGQMIGNSKAMRDLDHRTLGIAIEQDVGLGIEEKRCDVVLEWSPAAALVVDEPRRPRADHDVAGLEVAVQEEPRFRGEQVRHQAMEVGLETLLAEGDVGQLEEDGVPLIGALAELGAAAKASVITAWNGAKMTPVSAGEPGYVTLST